MAEGSFLLLCSITLLLLPPAAPQQVQDQVQDLSRRNTDFAGRLYRSISSRSDDNIFFSPFAVTAALAALASGSGGATRQQLLQALDLADLDPQQIPDLFQNLRNLIMTGGRFPLQQGIALLPSHGFPVSSSFLNLVQDKYGGNVQTLSYQNPQEAQSTINNWAQTQTGGQLKTAVASLDQETKMLLISVAYCQSQFAQVFDASFTQEDRFFVDKYHVVQVPMMFRSDKFYLAYDASARLGLLKLPMTEGTAMLVLLPDEDTDIGSVEEEISGHRLRAWLGRLQKTRLEVQLPRFLLERSLALNDVLQRLDIKDVFTGSADLSVLTEEPGLRLSQVFHKAAITVDEKSNMAARGGASTSGSLPPRLSINRPFVFIVFQEESSSVLFMGRVVNPTLK